MIATRPFRRDAGPIASPALPVTAASDALRIIDAVVGRVALVGAVLWHGSIAARGEAIVVTRL